MSSRLPRTDGPDPQRQVWGAPAGPTGRWPWAPGPPPARPGRPPPLCSPPTTAPTPTRTRAGTRGSANPSPRSKKVAAGDVASSPLPLPSPAASALHSRAPAYPQLLEIRHFIPPAGAAVATAPPPAAANDAAATRAATAASSNILHWAPLKTPRPLPPPPPGPSRDGHGSSAPGARGPAHLATPRTQPATSLRVFRPRCPGLC